MDIRAAGVLRRGTLLDAVGEQHHRVAVIGFLEAPLQPFFGQQAGDEVEIGFAILAAIAARAGGLHERHRLVAPAPYRQQRVLLEHGLNDFDDGLVLPDKAVARLAQAPNERLNSRL